jgi:hypothetical protein
MHFLVQKRSKTILAEAMGAIDEIQQQKQGWPATSYGA